MSAYLVARALFGGPLRAAGVGQAMALPRATVYHHLRMLERAGQARRSGGGEWELTDEGRRYAGTAQPVPAHLADVVDAVEQEPYSTDEDVAEALGVSRARAVSLLLRASAHGWLEHTESRGVRVWRRRGAA
jgi:DNA-binding IclR family transcriptional regulator